ncbi:inorganic phosphate transporter [Brevibacterium sp. VCM10]|uniref:inorganic phosphate transporter n=1 Tax=Brevibacterium sp. VCM10 TaxID=1381751 RepID=UPI0004AF38E7|nr:inorganic phosphate transporter [Brevibacterium sp. VCM10]
MTTDTLAHSSPRLTPRPRFLGPDRWWHICFGLMLAATLVSFTLWSFDLVGAGSNRLVLITTIVFGTFMAFNIGGNDVANSFGTSVGAGTLSMKQALMVAAVFEVSGAVLAGGEVTDTVRSGIVGAALTSGFVTGTGGFGMVQWGGIGTIAISWVLSPALGGAVAFVLFGAIRRHILVYNDEADAKLREIKTAKAELRQEHKKAFERLDEIQQISYTNAMTRDAVLINEPDYDPDELESDYFRRMAAIETERSGLNSHRALETWVPLLAAFGSIVISSMLLFKGLKNLELGISSVGNFLIMAMIGAGVWIAVFIFTKTLKKQTLSRSTFLLFSWMQVFTASAFAFSHGSNDIANAIGPFAAILDVLRTNEINAEAGVPAAAMITCGIALVAGLWFIGRNVIRTVGTGLTKIHPASGFAAELSAAGVVMAASVLGLPVSSTHILIGAILGVGLVNRAANWNLMKPIALAWVITLPAAEAIGAIGLVSLRAIFG